MLALALEAPRLRLVVRHLRARRLEHGGRLLALRHRGGHLAHERHSLAHVLLQKRKLLHARVQLAQLRLSRGGPLPLALNRGAHLRQRALLTLRARRAVSHRRLSPDAAARKERRARTRTSGASTIFARNASLSARAACTACLVAASLSATSWPSAFKSRTVASSASCSSASALSRFCSSAISASSAATRCAAAGARQRRSAGRQRKRDSWAAMPLARGMAGTHRRISGAGGGDASQLFALRGDAGVARQRGPQMRARE